MTVEQVVTRILQKLPYQKFAIKRMTQLWTPEEKARFEQELEYLTEKYSLEKVVEGYVFTTNSTINASKYFREYGDYPNHSFEEVNRNVYANPEETTLRMVGLCVAEYLWETVLKIHRFYEKAIARVGGERYLEIGPGHGKYFLEAYNHDRFQKYVAVDVSPTSIKMTEEYMKRYATARGGYELLCQDATLLDTNTQYDFIVAQEVLEHIEDPLGMLKKIHELLTPTGTAYVLMPITAPSPTHIFLFRNVAHVKSMVEEAGFEIETEEYITANNVPVEAAEERKLPINAALIIKKKGAE